MQKVENAQIYLTLILGIETNSYKEPMRQSVCTGADVSSWPRSFSTHKRR